jgi:drug/metabolite transporter (DMT)-like permease
MNSGFLLIEGPSPLPTSEELWQGLVIMAVFTAIGTILSNHMYQYFKVSWSVIILNLQIVVAFAFDVIVMKEEFS